MLYLKFSIFKIEQIWVKKQQLLNLNSVVVNFYSIYTYIYIHIYIYLYVYIYYIYITYKYILYNI